MTQPASAQVPVVAAHTPASHARESSQASSATRRLLCDSRTCCSAALVRLALASAAPHSALMKVRYEAGFRFATSTESNLALLTLTRLVKSGLLPPTTKATDPVSPLVLERFTAQHPALPAPKDLGELLRAFAGDSDGDGAVDLNLAALAETSLITLDVPALEAAGKLVLSADEFVAVGAGHAQLMPEVDPATLVVSQGSIYDEVESSASTADGLVSYLRTQGFSGLALSAPLTLNEKGELGRGPGSPELRHFESARLQLLDTGLSLTLSGSSGTTQLLVSASGRLKESIPRWGPPRPVAPTPRSRSGCSTRS